MKVELLYNTPLWVCSKAIRKCWASEDKSDTICYNDAFIIGTKDKELIERIGNKNKHKSTLEHLVYTFDIDGISRACLQEVARHRMASYSVKSSRYTLAKVLKDGCVDDVYTHTGIVSLDEKIEEAIITIANNTHIQNDLLKYMIPEALHTSLVMTINARSLQNFLSLRTSPSALWEIRQLAYALYEAIPKEHKYLFEDSLYKELNNKVGE